MNHPPNYSSHRELLEYIIEHGGEVASARIQETLLNEAMLLEREQHLGAGRYERSPERVGYANGFKPRQLNSRVGSLNLRIPQTRDSNFFPKVLERGCRSERAFLAAICQMYIQGVSTRKVTDILEALCGFEITSQQVSNTVKAIDEEIKTWRGRALGPTPILFLDAEYEKVRHDGNVQNLAVLTAAGVDEDGNRRILGVSVSTGEAEVNWREFLEGLTERGLCGVRLIVSDAHSGLKKATARSFPGVPWNRCQFHLQQNLMSKVTSLDKRKLVASEVRSILKAPDIKQAEENLFKVVKKYRGKDDLLADWIEENVPEGLSVLRLGWPDHHQRRLRTNNMLERIYKEVRRRTKVVSIFPNAASLLRLVSAIFMEIDEDWQSQKVYLDMSDLLSSSP